MERKSRIIDFIALAIVFVFICSLLIMSLHNSGQAASPAAGLERHEQTGLNCQGSHEESPPKAMVPGAQGMTCRPAAVKGAVKKEKTKKDNHADN